MKWIYLLVIIGNYGYAEVLSKSAQTKMSHKNSATTAPRIKLSQQEKNAPLFIYVDKSAHVQKMHVFKKGVLTETFSISTGREVGESNYKNPNFAPYCSSTPTGEFKPTQVKDVHNSNQWSGANMYNTIFFHGGYAIHGVDEHYYENLGSRASGGCIRLTQENSKKLIDWVREVGQQNVKIRIEDTSSDLEKYQIADECFRQQRIVKCTQKELKKFGTYKPENKVEKEVNGQKFYTYEVDRGNAYNIEENVCRLRLQATGELYIGPPKYSIRPKPRPSDLCINQNLPPEKNPCSEKYQDGLF